MPRLSIQQTNFSAGEISPRLVGRTDIEKYPNAAKQLINSHPVIHGGAVRRAGTRFAAATKFAATVCRLVDFVVSQDVSYMLEFGNLYVRVFLPNGVFVVEIASPYTAAQAQALDYTQGADTMFLWHADVAPQRLRRFSNANWSISDTPFTVAPFDEQGHALAANLTLSATSGAITATASAGVFLASDVGRILNSGAGAGTITAVTSPTVVALTTSTSFAGLSLLSQAWTLDASPFGFAIPAAQNPPGTSITVAGATTRAATLTLTAKTGAITINASAAVFTAADTGRRLYADSGIVTLTFVNASQCTGTTSVDFLYTVYQTGSWGITGGVWRAVDVGKYMRINGGQLKVTGFTSDGAITASIVTALTSVIASSPQAWTLEGPMWTAANGYPRTGTLHEQRLWAAGSPKFPQTIWGSRTGLYLDFQKGVADSDACIFTVASDEINPISYLASGRAMLVLTYGGEFSMEGGTDRPITPSSVQIKPQTTYGSRSVRPVMVGKESLFVQRAGRKVRAMSYEFTNDGYSAPDIAVLAEHITESGIVDMAYQQEPDLLLWLVLADGTLLSCTLDRDQNVVGWAKHYTNGAFESVASIPNGDSEQVWVVVRRIVNGVTVRYIEYLDAAFEPALPGAVDPAALPPIAAPVVYGCTVDAGIVVDNVAGQTVFTGLGHLEGHTVDVVADGSAMPQAVVTGGAITLPRASYRTLIGLPFNSLVQMLTPEVGTRTGTAQGNSMRTGEITLRFLNTLGCTVRDGEGRAQDLPFRTFGSGTFDAPLPFTGDARIEMLGWERGRSALSIEQNQPLPMHLVAVIRKYTVND